MATKNAIQTSNGLDVNDIVSADELFDLDQIVEPLIPIDTYLGRDVWIKDAQPKISPKGDKYLILVVQDIETGNTFKSSCSHWFMMEFIRKVEEKGLHPFPLGVNFYKEGNSIKFTGIQKEGKKTPSQTRLLQDKQDIPF